MERKTVVAVLPSLIALATAGGALADQPPGQLSYEGQPGNQGGASGNPGNDNAPGLRSYEGQPGDQGG